MFLAKGSGTVSPQVYISLSSFHQEKAEVNLPWAPVLWSPARWEPHHTPQQLLAAACFSGTVTSNTFDLAPQLSLNSSPVREHITCQANTLRGWEACNQKDTRKILRSQLSSLICHKAAQWHSGVEGTVLCRLQPECPHAPVPACGPSLSLEGNSGQPLNNSGVSSSEIQIKFLFGSCFFSLRLPTWHLFSSNLSIPGLLMEKTT